MLGRLKMLGGMTGAGREIEKDTPEQGSLPHCNERKSRRPRWLYINVDGSSASFTHDANLALVTGSSLICRILGNAIPTRQPPPLSAGKGCTSGLSSGGRKNSCAVRSTPPARRPRPGEGADMRHSGASLILGFYSSRSRSSATSLEIAILRWPLSPVA